MEDLVKLKTNLFCLIRLAKTELNDIIDDLKINKQQIDFYTKKDPIKYASVIKLLQNFTDIIIFVIMNRSNELQGYYEDLKALENVKAPSEYPISDEINPNIFKISELQDDLESSVLNLSNNYNKTQMYNEMFKHLGLNFKFSQTEYYINDVLDKYEKINQARIKYNINGPVLLMKK